MRDLEIFAQALEIDDPDRRLQFIHSACGNERELLAQVAALLASHQESGSLLEKSPVATGLAAELLAATELEMDFDGGKTRDGSMPAAADWGLSAERQVGPYRLLEKIGEGGFGEVYVAEQTAPVHRKVAIKIIKPGMDSREVVARFSAERQALAMMDHPNIAKVFDGGTTPRGLPYFVMELVRGMSLVKYCDSVRLSIEQRLKLFIDTCRAIQHAHQKGIIHRDIKPSNVLVTLHDGVPVVKVIDFGVAKALNQRLTDMTVYTRFSFMIGTPAYMSPEQAELSGLDIDTRSDIYSLGVLLYELITGAPPFLPERFAKATMDEMRRIIRDEEPQRPSLKISTLGETSTSIAKLRGIESRRLHTILKGDLDWIVMKAMAKDRSMRYDTANGLATDVQKFLEGNAISARPPSWRYLTSRFIRRNRSLVLSAAVILAILIIGSLVSISLAIWASYERSVAQEQERIARGKTSEAEGLRKRAEQAEHEALQRLLDSRLTLADLQLGSKRVGQQHQCLATVAESLELSRRIGNLDELRLRLRSQAIAALARVDLNSMVEVETAPEASRFYSFTADMSRVAYRIREQEKNFVVVRGTDAMSTEYHRVLYRFATQSNFHDEVVPILSPNGRYLAMGTTQNDMVLWDLQENKLIREMPAYFPIGGFQFAADSNSFAVVVRGPGNGLERVEWCGLPECETLRVWELSQVRRLSFCPKNQHLAVGGPTGVSLLTLSDGKTVAKLNRIFGGWGPALAWSRSGEYLATTMKRQIEVWRVADLMQDSPSKCVNANGLEASVVPTAFTVLNGHEGDVESLSFHPQVESLLISSGWDNTLRFWNIFSAAEQLMVPESRPTLSATGDQIAVATATGYRIYELLSGELCRWLYRGGAQQIVINATGQWLAIGTDQGTRFWSLPNLEPLGQVGDRESYGIAWDRVNQQLLLGNHLGVFETPLVSQHNALQLGPAKQILTTSMSHFGHLFCSRDGRWLGAGENGDWAPVIRDRRSEMAYRIRRPTRSQTHCMSNNSLWYAQFVGDCVQVRDLSSGSEVASIPVDGSAGLVFSPDNRYLLISSNSGTKLVDTKTWQYETEIKQTILMFTPAFNLEGSLSILAKGPGEVVLVNFGDRQAIAELAYPDPPRLFAFAALSDDNRFLVVSHETSATLWDMAKIRLKLATLGLDWESHPAEYKPTTTEIKKLHVVPGDIERLKHFFEQVDAAPRSEAVSTANSFLQTGDPLPDFYFFRAWGAEALGKYDDACRDYEQAVLQAPYALSWREDYADCLMQALRWEESVREYLYLADPRQSNIAIKAFRQLGALAAGQPTAFDPESRTRFRDLLETFWEALRGECDNPYFQTLTDGLIDDTRQSMWEAVALGLFGLGDVDQAAEIFDQYGIPDGIGDVTMLAAIYAERNELDQAELLLAKAEAFPRQQTGRSFSPMQARLYQSLATTVRSRIAAKRGTNETVPRPVKQKTHDSIELLRLAQVNVGRLAAIPLTSNPELSEALDGNVLFWELLEPNHELRFVIPVPGPGKYRVTAGLVQTLDTGNFEVQDSMGKVLAELNLFFQAAAAGDPSARLSMETELGEFPAIERQSGLPENPSDWVVTVIFNSTGHDQKAAQYSLLIDQLTWRLME